MHPLLKKILDPALLKHDYFVFTANQWRNNLSKAFSAPLSVSVLFMTDFQSKIEDKGVSRVSRRLLLLFLPFGSCSNRANVTNRSG